MIKPVECRKCEKRLTYMKPHHMMIHCGTDYWTRNGDRLWKPTVCARCKSDNGRHALQEQKKQNDTRKMETVLNKLFSEVDF